MVGCEKACLDIGLNNKQADRQISNIAKSLLFEGNHLKFGVVQNEANRSVTREVVCLNEKFVPMWLAQISLTPTMRKENPKAVDKLLRYQLEAADVLHKAFYETDEQKETLHKSLGIEGEVADLKIAVEATTEQLRDQSEKLQKVMDNMTINTIQQGRLLSHAKDRVRFLLGGTHSDEYKEDSRKYFSNLWMNFKETFICASYKDLNPKYFGKALEFVDGWNYKER